jgi:hypothetical protein
MTVTLQTMYAGQANSPMTSVASGITASSTEITVLDVSILPAAPMLLVLGADTESAETVLCTAKNTSYNRLTVTRGVEGAAKAWDSGTTVCRAFCATDLNTVQSNINALNTGKADSSALSSYLALAGGTMTGNIAMGSNKITGLAAASANGEAVRYEQLSSYLPLAGGTMSGAIAMGNKKITDLAAGSSNGDALRYEQLGAALASYLPLAGGTMTGALNMGSKKITSLAAGSANTDAANYKQLTDGLATKQASITASGILKGTGSAVTAATADTDYSTPAGVGTLITNRINRTSAVTAAATDASSQADSGSNTLYMVRGEALNTTETTPSVNGQICWTVGNAT